MANKIDSNVVGLRYAEELSVKTLPGSPVWYPLEPNSFGDFGGQISTVARNPINPTRQNQKGVTTDLDASGGFVNDMTQDGLTRLLQGFFFADIREKATNNPMNGTATVCSTVTAGTKTYTMSSGTFGSQFAAGDLLVASGFAQSANNGLKNVASSTATTIVVTQTSVDETTSGAPDLTKVGWQFGSAEVSIDVTGSYPRLLRASGTKDFTTFGLIPGEWVFIGGDTAATQFALSTSNGFARVRSVAVTYIEFDKTANTMVADAGTGKTIQIFYGNVIKNEATAALIKRRTYQLERTLGADANGTMSEYIIGAVPNTLNLAIKQADKITVEGSFVAMGSEQRTGLTGVKSGTRPTLGTLPAFNTSSDFSRIKMNTITAGVTNPTALFAFISELTLSINNNVSPNKAVGVLGAFDATAGQFEVSGSITAYFADMTAVQSVMNNSDVTLDFAVVKNNAGHIWDIPLITLGNGRLSVQQDQAIMIPLSVQAAAGSNNHTLLFNEFPYLPTLADV